MKFFVCIAKVCKSHHMWALTELRSVRSIRTRSSFVFPLPHPPLPLMTDPPGSGPPRLQSPSAPSLGSGALTPRDPSSFTGRRHDGLPHQHVHDGCHVRSGCLHGAHPGPSRMAPLTRGSWGLTSAMGSNGPGSISHRILPVRVRPRHPAPSWLIHNTVERVFSAHCSLRERSKDDG